MKSNRNVADSPRHGWIVVPLFAAAVLLTLTNIAAPTTSSISMLHVYTTNSTPSMDNVNVDLGLYGYCSWEPVAGYGNTIEEAYCTSPGVGYDPAYALKYAMFDPTDIVSPSAADRYRGLTKPLLVHGIAAGLAWCSFAVAVAGAVWCKGMMRTLAEPVLVAATFAVAAVCFGLDTALFVPLRGAMAPYSMSCVLGAGYWMVVASLVLVALATLFVVVECCIARRRSRRSRRPRQSPAYRTVENTPMLSEIALEQQQE